MVGVLTPFRNLRWKLTFSYTLVTAATLVVLEAIVLGALIFAAHALFPLFMGRYMAPALALTFQPFLEAEPPDVESLNAMLNVQYADSGQLQLNGTEINLTSESDAMTLMVLDRDGVLLSALDVRDIPAETGRVWDAGVVPGFEPLVQNALAGRANEDPYYVQAGDLMYFVSPITGEDHRPLGALVLAVQPDSSWSLLQSFLTIIGSSLLCFLCGAGLVGTIFGFFTARDLTRRLAGLQAASAAWSEGRFGIRASDASGDEIGQLARRLNLMAEQLQAYMQTRQELAAIEERNRLARDLHDSVKQQIFATAMQLGAARELVERDPASARRHLDEAEHLASNARDELSQLIRELRPAAFEGKGLAEALREYVEDWSRQSAIPAELRVQGERSLPLLVEQTIFRVAQEALSNVARHSRATRAEVLLKADNESVMLSVSDNGRGFETDKVKKGVGLDSMRERVEALGGNLQVDAGSQGAVVRATLRTAPPEPAPAPATGIVLQASFDVSPFRDKKNE